MLTLKFAGVWKGDLYGVGAVLGAKREQRGWNDSCLAQIGEGKDEHIDKLLEWRGGETRVEIYSGYLPWDVVDQQ